MQAVKWNNVNDQTLLTAGYDNKINILDVRSAADMVSTKIAKSAKDIEMVQWHHKLEHNFAVTTESGIVFGYDTRKIAEPVFTLQAHNKACPNMSFSPFIPNMMATSSLDGLIKVWDIAANGGTKPEMVGSRNMKQGDLYSMSFSNDIPWVLASGGNTGEIAIWDVSENINIENHFKQFLVKGTYNPEDYDPD